MSTTATNIKRLITDVAGAIPDGTYEGNWGGYVVTFRVGSETYEAKTKDGIRTPHCPCVVTVSGGQIEVRAK